MSSVAQKLTSGYKFHGRVIYLDEARKIGLRVESLAAGYHEGRVGQAQANNCDDKIPVARNAITTTLPVLMASTTT